MSMIMNLSKIDMKIPDTLHRCEDAVVVAQELIDALSDDDYNLESFRWSKADVRSLERYDITFTDKEREFFNSLLSDLYSHAQYPNWMYSTVLDDHPFSWMNSL